MSCSGALSLNDESATKGSVDNRFIDDGLSLLPSPDIDTIHNESMKHDWSVEKDQDSPSDESIVNGK